MDAINKRLNEIISYHKEKFEEYKEKIKLLNVLEDILRNPHKYIIIKNNFEDKSIYTHESVETYIYYNLFVKPNMILKIYISGIWYDRYKLGLTLYNNKNYANFYKEFSGKDDLNDKELQIFNNNTELMEEHECRAYTKEGICGAQEIIIEFKKLLDILQPMNFEDYIKQASADREFVKFIYKNRKVDYKRCKKERFYNLW